MTTLCPLTGADRPLLARLFQLYLHDMSEHSGWAIGPDGRFSYPPDLLPPYWERGDHHPYLITHGSETAGFCLIRRAPDDARAWDMGQFFVLRKFRRQAVGGAAFAQALDRHPGHWQVRVLIENRPAYEFWKARIAALSCVDLSEERRVYGRRSMTYFTFRTVN